MNRRDAMKNLAAGVVAVVVAETADAQIENGNRLFVLEMKDGKIVSDQEEIFANSQWDDETNTLKRSAIVWVNEENHFLYRETIVGVDVYTLPAVKGKIVWGEVKITQSLYQRSSDIKLSPTEKSFAIEVPKFSGYQTFPFPEKHLAFINLHRNRRRVEYLAKRLENGEISIEYAIDMLSRGKKKSKNPELAAALNVAIKSGNPVDVALSILKNG